jgi:tetratricopeptide (TPR) repeat protein
MAQDEQKAFVEAAAKVPPDAMMNLNTSKDLLAVASAMLDATIADALGNTDDRGPAWRKAVEAEDKLAYDEPPAWFYPMRESLGGALMSDGRAEQVNEAVNVFRADLKLNPGNGRSLFGLAEALKMQHQPEEAVKALAQFKTAWAHADIPATLIDLGVVRP